MQAPGEGEAMCAALSSTGTADLVWSCDVIDSLIFGARTVMTHVRDGLKRSQALCSKDPHKSCFLVVTLEGVQEQFSLAVRNPGDVASTRCCLVCCAQCMGLSCTEWNVRCAA